MQPEYFASCSFYRKSVRERMCRIKKILIIEPGSLYAAMKPAFYFNWILGMCFHVQSDPSSGPSHFCTKLYSVLFFIVNFLLTYIGWTTTGVLSDDSNTHSVAFTMYIVLFYVASSIAVSSPFFALLRNRRLQDCLRQLSILDDTFQVVLGAPKEYRKQYISSICQIVAVVTILLIVTISDTPWVITTENSPLEILAITFTLHHPIVVLLVLDLNFCSFIGYLGKKFRDMNEILLRLAGKSSDPYTSKKILVNSQKISKITVDGQITDVNAEELVNNDYRILCEIRKAHSTLYRISQKINFAFGVQNLLSMGISFAMVTGMLYTIYNIIIAAGKLTTEMISPFNWTVIYTFKIWVVNHTCSTASNEANRTGDLIYELRESKVDRKLHREVGQCRVKKIDSLLFSIQEFGVQMLQNPVRFNACGFFSLDYSFLHGVIGSITTYLVILIQMNKSSESDRSHTALIQNNSRN